jgi:hypothetical protein
MHVCARSGNEGVLLSIVNKIGPGSVQIVQNKQSKVPEIEIEPFDTFSRVDGHRYSKRAIVDIRVSFAHF